jgi:predicted PurR-regulated permease PerM
MRTNNNEYSPIQYWWKYAISFFILLFLAAILIVACTTFTHFFQYYPSHGMTYLMTLHAILSLAVCICFFLCINKLISIFAKNLEHEKDILASLYMEMEKRRIIRNDEKEINKLKEEIKEKLMQEVPKSQNKQNN